MFATHVLAPLALTSLLTRTLETSASARVINVSSGGMYGQALPVGDWESAGTAYSPKKLYARTKREQMVVTERLAECLRGRGVLVHGMHPGWADTEGVRRWMPVLRSPAQSSVPPRRGPTRSCGSGARRQRSSAPDSSGRTVAPARPHRLGAGPDSEEDRQALWRYCVDALARAGITGL